MILTQQGFPWLAGDAMRGLLPFPDAVTTLRTVLAAGPADLVTPERISVPAPGGHVLLMPAVDRRMFGVKIAGVAPANPQRGLPRITGSYLLYDADTLLPVLAMDGPALTLLRTAALSALAVDLLTPPDADHLLVFGTGPQAEAHLEAIRTVRPLRQAAVSGRTVASTSAFAAKHSVDQAGPDSLGDADIVVCCTSASEPLFDGRRLGPQATVVAMGSHTADARELDEATLSGAQVVVEDPATADREAADVALALRSGAVTTTTSLADIVNGRAAVRLDGRRVFRSVGMAWEDLVIATALFDRYPR